MLKKYFTVLWCGHDIYDICRTWYRYTEPKHMHSQFTVLLWNMQAKQERIKSGYHKKANFIASSGKIGTIIKFYKVL